MLIVVLSHASRALPGWAEALATLRSAGHDVLDPGPTIAPREHADALREADGMLAGLGPVTRDMLERAPRLRVIAKPGVGYDNIDVRRATELGIAVCNTPGSNAECVADHTMALMLAVVRKVVELDALTRSGRGWTEVSIAPPELTGRRLALIGMGHIGRAVARRAVHGFGMDVSACTRTPDPALAAALGIALRPFPEVLRDADVVSVHVPLTPATRGLIGAPELELMRRGAILVNTARGGIVDETGLAAALMRGHLAGAGVDVFETEPCVRSPLFDAPNTVLTPHLAGRSPEAARRGRLTAAEDLVHALAGRPRHLVNPEVLALPHCRVAGRGGGGFTRTLDTLERRPAAMPVGDVLEVDREAQHEAVVERVRADAEAEKQPGAPEAHRD